jgi:hypothetical protein
MKMYDHSLSSDKINRINLIEIKTKVQLETKT